MRVITVTGKRGTLVREFKHTNLDITKTEEGNVKVDLWFGKRKQLACIRTICSHIENMCTGVMKGYTYKMRVVYSHLPINVPLSGKNVEIRNYLGAKLVRRVKLCDLRRCRVRADCGCQGSDRAYGQRHQRGVADRGQHPADDEGFDARYP